MRFLRHVSTVNENEKPQRSGWASVPGVLLNVPLYKNCCGGEQLRPAMTFSDYKRILLFASIVIKL